MEKSNVEKGNVEKATWKKATCTTTPARFQYVSWCDGVCRTTTMVQFYQPGSAHDKAVDVRRDGVFLFTKYFPADFTVRDLVVYLGNGCEKCFLHSSITQDISYVTGPHLNRALASYPMNPLYFEAQVCREPHECVLNDMGMCIGGHGDMHDVVELSSGDDTDEEIPDLIESSEEEEEEDPRGVQGVQQVQGVHAYIAEVD